MKKKVLRMAIPKKEIERKHFIQGVLIFSLLAIAACLIIFTMMGEVLP